MIPLSTLPVAVIGGGPVGLAAAAHLVTRSLPVRLYESARHVGAHVRAWGHVRLFSPWRFNTDAAAVALLSDRGWQKPAPARLPTGHELVAEYLEPLAQIPAMRGVIETGVTVRAITRQGIDKVVSRDRADHPFAIAVTGQAGKSRIDHARAVIDATGTWQNPNPLGANGIPAVGEIELAERIAYGVPDVLGAGRDLYSGKRVLVVGGGHSAANVLFDLARLGEADRGLRVTWAVRSANLARLFGGGAADRLAARGKLGTDLQELVRSKRITVVTGFAAERVADTDAGLVVSGRTASDALALDPVDRIIVATGQRPDLMLTRELRLDLDPWLESPRALGPLIDPNLHSCGSVPPHGYKELAHHEPGYFTVGIKSYGRAPTFLVATGYEQVRSVVAHLAGDDAAADDVRLVLPETGVCSATRAPAAVTALCPEPARIGAEACCSAAAQP